MLRKSFNVFYFISFNWNLALCCIAYKYDWLCLVSTVFSSNPYCFPSSFNWFTNLCKFSWFFINRVYVVCVFQITESHCMNWDALFCSSELTLCTLFLDAWWRYQVILCVLVLCLCLYGTLFLFLYLLLWPLLNFHLSLSVMQSVYCPVHMIPVQPSVTLWSMLSNAFWKSIYQL